MRTTLDLLLLIVTLLCQRLGLNSSNSSKPASTDPNRKKEPKNSSEKNSGGQKGHNGSTLPLDSHPEPKKNKSRNSLERLQNYEDDVLRFMVDREVPFTNNQGENDLRMEKFRQKISGCFRSEYGTEMFFAQKLPIKL